MGQSNELGLSVNFGKVVASAMLLGLTASALAQVPSKFEANTQQVAALPLAGGQSKASGASLAKSASEQYRIAKQTIDNGSIDSNLDVGIGTTDPQSPLHVTGGPDVTPAGGGFLVLGNTTGSNLEHRKHKAHFQVAAAS